MTMERRISRLEDAYRPGVDRAMVESIAAANDLDQHELLFEAEQIASTMDRQLSRPHTIKRMCDHLARVDGMSAQEHDDLLADAERIATQGKRR